ncbi:hypothetical protein [Albibacillus kandeliae]|uniref:hypothetical protein n=1 Tax=Albibacillus kandeliae TaxID=2174228 RepID=UPI000D69E811|nr:hypothetical protein [Albibacillus kandeliae]
MHRLQEPRKTILIARAALDELRQASSDFFSEKLVPPNVVPTRPYSVVEYPEIATGDFVYKFRITQPYPFKMERLAAEAIQSGKNAFDQAIYSATKALGKLPKRGNLHMPWSRDPSDMRGRVEKKNIIPEVLRDSIYSQEPYYTGKGYIGGNDTIRRIAQLANAKHTVGFAINTTAVILQRPSISGTGVYRVSTQVPKVWNTAKNEVFIARTPAKATIHDDYVVDFQVALDEPAPLCDIPAFEALSRFLDKAEELTLDLEKVLNEHI